MTARPPRRRLLVLAGLAVAVLAVLGWALSQRTDPRDLVVAYTDAIAAGDVEAANALATDGVPSGAGLPEPGSMDDVEPVSGVQVEQDGRDTSVSPLAGPGYRAVGYDVSYELGGRLVSDSVFVERTGGWWLWSQWRIRESLAQPVRLWLQQPLLEVVVGVGSAGPDAVAGRTVTEVPLYPGTYRVVPDPDGPVPLDPQELAVGDESPFLALVAGPEQLRAGAEDDLLAAAAETLDRCTDTADDRLSCDGGAVAVADDADGRVTWRVEGDLALDEDAAFAQTWRTSATVVATWTDPDGTAREQRFTLDGQATVSSVTPDAVQVVARWTRADDA